MADEKIRDLPALVTPALNILLEVEVPDEPTESLKSKKATWNQIIDILNASGLLNTGSLQSQAVTFATQQDISSQSFIGRNTAGPGSQEEISTATALTMLLDGATFTPVTVASDDKVIIQDTSDSDNAKTVTAQEIADLSSTANVIGKHTLWIPVKDMEPALTAGCAPRALVQSSSGRADYQVMDFDPSADENAQFSVAFPKSWNKGTLTYQVFWVSEINSTGGVAWAMGAVAVANEERIQDHGFPIRKILIDNSTSAFPNELLVSSESTPFTVEGSPADNNMVFFEIERAVFNVADDFAADARLVGVKIFFTTDAANDN